MSERSERSVEAEADDRLVTALLSTLSPGEGVAAERRLERVMAGLGAGRRSDSPDGGPAGAHDRSGHVRWAWRPIGAGLAAMIVLSLFLLNRPMPATAADWMARAEAAATFEISRLVAYGVDIVPHTDAPDPTPVRGRLLLEAVEGGRPLFRVDVLGPADRRHAVGVDRQGGWLRTGRRQLREFPAERLPNHLVIRELDLVIDPLPALLARVERDYDVVEVVEGAEPRLRAVHRENQMRNPRAPEEIEITLDPLDWSMRTLLLRWSADRRPAPSGAKGREDRGSRPRPPRGGRPDGPRPDGPGREPRREGPPPPFELKLERLAVDDSMAVDRDRP